VPGKVSSQQSTYQLPDEDSILSDLLGEEVDLEKEAEFFRSVLFGESDTEPAQKARAKASKRPAPSEPSPGQEGEVKDLTEKITRLQAEFENYRKRVIREAKEAKKFYNDKLILDLLPIVDNFERAIEHMKNLAEQKSILEGVQLIYRQMLGMLENSGLQAIDTSDEKFNPLYHEALGTFVNDEVEPGTILTEYETGYLLNGRLLRPSKVLVARGSQNGNSDQKSEEPAEAASADIEPSDPDASEESSGDTESADSPGKKKTNGTE
jgi:molecular chaperone GrpE